MKSTYKEERLSKLKNVILEYVNKNDKFPTFQELRKTYKNETNTVIGEYKGYDNFLKAYGLYELKLGLIDRQKEEELEVLEDLAQKLRKTMLKKGEVERKYPEHYKVFSKHYHNKNGGYIQFLKDYGLKEEYDLIMSPIASLSKEERVRYYKNKILEIIRDYATESNQLTVDLINIKEYRNLQHYSKSLGKTVNQAVRELGYIPLIDMKYIDEERYYNNKIIEILEPIADDYKKINEYLSKLDCYPSLYYYSKKIGKTVEQAVKDLGYIPL